MFTGIDKNGNSVHITNYNNENLVCPECGCELIVKRGSVKVHHFAHKINSDCHIWGEMTEWHKDWQVEFGLKNAEIVLQDENEKHRADILINNNIIEFQSSPISFEDVIGRTEFYRKFYKINWIFKHPNFYLESNEWESRIAVSQIWGEEEYEEEDEEEYSNYCKEREKLISNLNTSRYSNLVLYKRLPKHIKYLVDNEIDVYIQLTDRRLIKLKKFFAKTKYGSLLFFNQLTKIDLINNFKSTIN